MWQFMLFPGLLFFAIVVLGVFAQRFFETALKEKNRSNGAKMLLAALFFSALFASCASYSVLVDSYYTVNDVLP